MQADLLFTHNCTRKLNSTVPHKICIILQQAVKIVAIHFSIGTSPLSHLSGEIKYLMSLSLVGNMTVCEHVIDGKKGPYESSSSYLGL